MSLLSPLFLLGAGLLIVPWVLHLLRQRNAPVQDFPSTRFLEHSDAASSKSKKLSYKKLLLLRLLLLLALCFVFAQPVIRTVSDWMGSARQHHIIVLDQTFSMQASGRWQAATDAVESLLSAIPDAHPVQLFGWTGALVPLHDSLQDRSAVQQALASAQAGYTQGDFGTLMRRLNIASADISLPVNAYLVSDMQASAMPPRLNDLLAPSIAALQLIAVGNSDAENRWVNARVRSLSNDSFAIAATLVGPPETDSTGTSATLLLDGRTVQTVPFTVQPGTTTQSAEFDPLVWPVAGDIDVYDVAIEPQDALPADDVRSVAVGADEQVRVLLTGSDLDANSRSLRFLQTALLTDDRNTVERDERLTGQPIGDFDVSVVHIDQPTSGDVLPALSQAVNSYRLAGGHVLAVIGRAGDYLVDVTVPAARIGTVDSTHPMRLDANGWRSVTVYRDVPVALPSSTSLATGGADQFRVLVATEAGSPVLIEQSAGQAAGKLLWLTLPLDGDASDLPLSPAFVPWLHSVVDYMVRYDQYPQRSTVGDTLQLRGNTQIFDPEGQAMLGVSASANGSTVSLSRPGVYQIQDRSGLQAVTVSTSAAESNLTVASPTLLTNWTEGIQASTDPNAVSTVAGQSGATGGQSSSAATDASATEARGTLVNLSRWVLLLCALLAILEICYANSLLSVRRSAS